MFRHEAICSKPEKYFCHVIAGEKFLDISKTTASSSDRDVSLLSIISSQAFTISEKKKKKERKKGEVEKEKKREKGEVKKEKKMSVYFLG